MLPFLQTVNTDFWQNILLSYQNFYHIFLCQRQKFTKKVPRVVSDCYHYYWRVQYTTFNAICNVLTSCNNKLNLVKVFNFVINALRNMYKLSRIVRFRDFWRTSLSPIMDKEGANPFKFKFREIVHQFFWLPCSDIIVCLISPFITDSVIRFT